MNKYDALIIGSGLGGFLCDYILSKQGYNVCIAEKGSQFSGYLQFFVRVWSCNGLWCPWCDDGSHFDLLCIIGNGLFDPQSE